MGRKYIVEIEEPDGADAVNYTVQIMRNSDVIGDIHQPLIPCQIRIGEIIMQDFLGD